MAAKEGLGRWGKKGRGGCGRIGGGSAGADGTVEPGGVVPGMMLMGGGMLICPGVPIQAKS